MKLHFKLRQIAAMIAIGVALAFVWQSEVKLNGLRAERAGLLEEARSLGILHETGRFPNEPLSTKSSQRGAREKIRRQGADIISVALGIQKAEYEGRADELETQKKKNTLNASLLGLSAAQVETLINVLRDAGEIQFLEREKLIASALNMLKHNDPEGFLALAMRPDDMIPEHIRTEAMALWVARDPATVVSWMQKHQDTRPDLINEDTKKAVISKISQEDPGLAFQALAQLNLDRPWFTARSIGLQAKTAELRSAAVRGLRAYLALIDDPQARKETAGLAYAGIANSLRWQGFDAAVNWLDGANLDDGEYFGITGSIGFNETRGTHAKWIEWMGVNLPPDLRAGRIHAIMSGWTASDHQDAGNWLTMAPESAGRDLALRTYATMVAPIDPGIAEQWALTLPSKPDRTALLKEIHHKWPEGQDAEKTGFAVRHGIR